MIGGNENQIMRDLIKAIINIQQGRCKEFPRKKTTEETAPRGE